jgi:hypothetical protein
MTRPILGRVLIRYFVTPHPSPEVCSAIFVVMLCVILVPPASVANYFFYAIVAAFDYLLMRITRWRLLGAVALHVGFCKPLRLSVVCHDQLV